VDQPNIFKKQAPVEHLFFRIHLSTKYERRDPVTILRILVCVEVDTESWQEVEWGKKPKFSGFCPFPGYINYAFSY
jgi:hypothetical protein